MRHSYIRHLTSRLPNDTTLSQDRLTRDKENRKPKYGASKRAPDQISEAPTGTSTNKIRFGSYFVGTFQLRVLETA